MKPGSWYQSANVAIEGILHAARTQRHLRWHFIVAAAVVLSGLLFGLSRIEFVVLALAISLVLITEILNTAVEAAVDLASEAFHPLAKVAKDTAAGAVFVASACAVVLGYLILYPYVARTFSEGLVLIRMAGETLAFISAVLVIILVILAKAKLGRGEPLVGGMPSGHAALSFSIWVSLVFLTGNALVAALSLMLALMVCHSRVALGIHGAREVVFGALLGGLVTLAVFLFFGV